MNDAPEPTSAIGEANGKEPPRIADAQPKQRMRLLSSHTWQDAINFVLSLGVIVVAVVFLALLGVSTFQKKTEIELIAAPKTFAEEKGYSPEVAARKLEDAMDDMVAVMERSPEAPQTRAISPQAKRSASNDQAVDIFVGTGQQPAVALVSDRPTVVLPGVGVSIDSLASVFQGVLCPTCREVITGEFTFMGNKLWLIVRANHHVVFANKEGGDPNQPDILLHQAAVALFDAVYPAAGAIAHNNFGNAKYRDGKLDDAIGEYRTAVKLDPASMVAHYNLGNALRDRGYIDEAVEVYRTAIRIEPDDAKIHTNLGIVLASQGRNDDAIAEYRTAIELDPRNANARANLGAALGAQGKREEAVAQYQKAIEIDPNNSSIFSSQGSTLLAQGRLDEAILAFRKAVALGGDDATLYFNLGLASFKSGKTEEAAAAYRQSLRRDPNNAYAHNNLGGALWSLGRLDEATAELRAAIALDPADQQAYTNLGNALRAQGKLSDAVAAYQAGLKAAPTYAYLVLPLHLVRLAAHQDDSAELKENAARLRRDAWPMPVVNYYLGLVSEAQMRKAAASGDEDDVRGQKCEADYYVASLLLLQGRPGDAKPLMAAAAAECPVNFSESVAAKSELKRLPPG